MSDHNDKQKDGFSESKETSSEMPDDGIPSCRYYAREATVAGD
jgi:hypothetical protein